MAEFAEQRPYDGEPNEFDALVSDLYEQIHDPYLIDMHRQALQVEQTVAASHDEDTGPMRQKLVQHLDGNWRYMGKKLEVSGTAWIKDPESPEMEPRLLIDESAVSRGFIFFTDTTETSQDLVARIGHLIEIDSGRKDGSVMPAVLCLKEDPHIRLPYPSPELRDRRFAYYHPEDAQLIDDLAFTARRDDQVIKDFAEYYFDANLDDPDDHESLRDGAQYLRARAELEDDINYSISICGDVIVVDEEGAGHPGYLRKPYTRMMKIEDIALRPADTSISELKGRERCVPYVVAKAFEEDSTDDKQLLIPYTSIVWISSDRHARPAPPAFS